MSILVANQVYR